MTEYTKKKCALCDDLFTPARKSQKYCKKEHKGNCVICKKPFLIKKLASPAVTCSNHCSSILSHSAASEKKRKENSLKKYGTEFPTQAESIKKKIQIGIEKSTIDTRFGSERFRQKIKEKYNVENVSQIKEIKEKKANTSIANYGVSNPMQSAEVRKKQNASFNKNHNVNTPREVGVNHLSEWANLTEFIKKKKMNIEDLSEYFGVKRDKMIRECRKQEMVHKVYQYGDFNSIKERDLVNFLENEHPLIKYVRNDRKILNGKELDFFFPENNLAIEISPTSTHNTLFGFNNSAGKEVNYHKEKFSKCSKLGIDLITVFDWHDFEKIKEMIGSKLNNNQTTVFARKLEYKEYTELSKDLFDKLSQWHLLSLPSNFKRKNTVGVLTDQNNVVMGIALWANNADKNTKELKRLVFRPNYKIPGGASKLIKNFTKGRKEVRRIMTFSDCDLGQGKVYEKLNFSLIKDSAPSLNYYQPYYKKHIKNLSLVMQGADRLLATFPNYEKIGIGDNLPTNREIVESYGFLPVYDCGYRKWELLL